MDEARRLASVRWSAALAALVVGLNLSVMNVAFADLRSTFPGARVTTLGWVVSAYTIVFGAVLVPAGRLADKLGRRSVFITGLVAFGAGSVLAGSAPWLWVLIMARVVQGIGAACITPASMALLLDATPIGQRAAATSFYSGVSSIGAASGPSLGALAVDQSSWRVAFFLGLPMLVASYALGRRTLPVGIKMRDTALPDLAGAGLLVVAMTCLSFGIVQGRSWGFDDPSIISAFTAAAVLVPVFVRRCNRHASPVMSIALFRRRSFAAANAAALFFGMTTGGVALANVLFLRDVWHYTLIGAGFGALPAAVSAMLAARAVGRWGVRFGEVAVGLPGAAGIVASMVWLRVMVGPTANYWQAWFPASVLLGLGLAASFPMIAVAVVRDVGPDELSLATATNRTFLQLGNAIGIALVVALLGATTAADALHEFRLAWSVLALLGVICSAAMFVTGSTERTVAAAEVVGQPA